MASRFEPGPLLTTVAPRKSAFLMYCVGCHIKLEVAARPTGERVLILFMCDDCKRVGDEGKTWFGRATELFAILPGADGEDLWPQYLVRTFGLLGDNSPVPARVVLWMTYDNFLLAGVGPFLGQELPVHVVERHEYRMTPLVEKEPFCPFCPGMEKEPEALNRHMCAAKGEFNRCKRIYDNMLRSFHPAPLLQHRGLSRSYPRQVEPQRMQQDDGGMLKAIRGLLWEYTPTSPEDVLSWMS